MYRTRRIDGRLKHRITLCRLTRAARPAASRALVVAVCATLVAACATGGGAAKPDLDAAQRYRDELARHSREVRLYHQLDTQLLAHVTLLSDRLRRAFLQEYTRLYPTDSQGLEKARTDLSRFWGEGVSFVIQVDSRRPELARLEPDKGIWQLRLENDEGILTAPASVTRIRHPSAIDHHFFPGTRDFGHTYVVAFSRYLSDVTDLADEGVREGLVPDDPQAAMPAEEEDCEDGPTPGKKAAQEKPVREKSARESIFADEALCFELEGDLVASRYLILRISGVTGSAELRWDLEGLFD